MKLLKKLLVIDIVFFVVAVLFHKVSIVGMIFLCLAAALVTYILLEYKRIKSEIKEVESVPIEIRRRNLIDEKLSKAKSTISFPNFPDHDSFFIKRANEQIATFLKKEDALKTIIGLNEGGCSSVLGKNNLDVYETIVENYRRISKRIVAYKATNNEDIPKEITSILNANDELLELYNRLIEEVSRMGDNFNEQDESLQNLISDLQNLRKSNQSDEDADDPFKLTSFPEE